MSLESSSERSILYLDHVTFPKAVGELLRDDPEFSGIAYSAQFPKSEEVVPSIRYRLLSRVPGMDGVETRGPRWRYDKTEENGTITQVFSQWMTCIYQFDIYSLSTDEADDISRRFERFMKRSVGFLLSLGAGKVIFNEQIEDQLAPRTSDTVVRSLRWLVRLESIETTNLPALEKFRVRVFLPVSEAYEAVVRGNTVDDGDTLVQPYISKILFVSDYSPSGIAREDNYLPGLDYDTWYDPITNKTVIQWLEPGRNPVPGTTYYVRYMYWSIISSICVPTASQSAYHRQEPFASIRNDIFG